MAETKDYLINTGIVPLLQNRWGLELPNPTIRELQRLEDAFLAEIKPIIEDEKQIFSSDGKTYNATLKDRNAVQLNDSMATLLRGESRPQLNFDDVYFRGQSDAFYSTTRTTNPDNLNDKKQGPRLGFVSMAEQAKALAKKFGTQEIVVLDIGTFDGDTLDTEVRRLIEAGVNVKAIYLATANKNGYNKLTEGEGSLKAQHGVDIKVAEGNMFDYADWVELRDFIGLDGRKVMREINGRTIPEFMPFKNQFLFIPYRENLGQWASLEYKTDDLKALCDKYTALFHGAIRAAGYSVVFEPIRTNKSVKENKSTETYILDFRKMHGGE